VSGSVAQAAQRPDPSRSSNLYSICNASTPAAEGDGLLSLLLEDGPRTAANGQLSSKLCSSGVLGAQHLLQPDLVPHDLPYSQPLLPRAVGMAVSQPIQYAGLQQQQQTLMPQAPAMSGGHSLFASHTSSCGIAANYSQTISIDVVGEHQAVLAPPAVAPAPPPALQLLHQTQQQQQQQHDEAAMLDSGLLPSLDELMQDDGLLQVLLQPAAPGCLAAGGSSSTGMLHNPVPVPAAPDKLLLLLDNQGWHGSPGYGY
jgi:hypothetical protein